MDPGSLAQVIRIRVAAIDVLAARHLIGQEKATEDIIVWPTVPSDVRAEGKLWLAAAFSRADLCFRFGSAAPDEHARREEPALTPSDRQSLRKEPDEYLELEDDKMKLCVLYARTADQDARSVEVQLNVLRDWVARMSMKSGEPCGIVNVHSDDGVTGTGIDRPSLHQLLEDADRGKVDTLVCQDLSRLTRGGPEDCVRVKE